MTLEQLSFLSVLFPKPQQVKHLNFYEQREAEHKAFEEKLQGFNLDEKIIARCKPWLINYGGEEEIGEIKEIAKTRDSIFKGVDCEIWAYDVPADKWNADTKQYDEYIGKQLAFRLGEQIIALTFVIQDIAADDIYFPAMAMVYVDTNGSEINFEIRDEFIEQGLGLLKHGKYRINDTTPRRLRGETDEEYRSRNFAFCTMKTTLDKIIAHLKAVGV